jgi:hypothetical protein
VTDSLGASVTDDMVVDVKSGPNVVSDLTPTVNGQLINGQTVTFNGRVLSSGGVPVTTAFSDNFTYRWGTSGAWLALGGHIAKSVPFAPGTTQNDTSAALALNQSGTLQVQHCVDSLGQVDEIPNPPGETDNCRIANLNVSTPVGTLTSSGCSITAGNSTCDISASWNSSYVLDPKIYNHLNALVGSTPSGTAGPYTVGRGNYTFTFRNGTALLDTESVTVDCAGGAAWNTISSTCEVPPVWSGDISIDIGPNPDIVRSGDTSDLTVLITTTDPADMTCTVLGAHNPPNPATDTIGYSGTSLMKVTITTKPLFSAQDIQVTCVVNGFPSITQTDTARISVVGQVQEI